MNIPRTILETVDVTKVFGMDGIQIHALNGISLSVRAGEFVAIMGASGSGKSTLLHILGCLSRPSSGRYLLDGEDVSDLDKNRLAGIRNQKIGFVFQAYNLLPRTTALRNVELPILYDRNRPRTMAESEIEAKAILEKVGLSDRMQHQPHELSGGQQQRVAIARALINEPVVVIADEPTGNLDTQSGREIMVLLQDLHQQGTTIVLVTHDEKIAGFANRTIRLSDGKILSDQSAARRS